MGESIISAFIGFVCYTRGHEKYKHVMARMLCCRHILAAKGP
jgi:hypothetical protein